MHNGAVHNLRLAPNTTEEAVRYLGAGDMLLSDSFPGQDRNKLCLSSKVPLGVVLCIPPFNCESPPLCCDPSVLKQPVAPRDAS